MRQPSVCFKFCSYNCYKVKTHVIVALIPTHLKTLELLLYNLPLGTSDVLLGDDVGISVQWSQRQTGMLIANCIKCPLISFTGKWFLVVMCVCVCECFTDCHAVNYYWLIKILICLSPNMLILIKMLLRLLTNKWWFFCSCYKMFTWIKECVKAKCSTAIQYYFDNSLHYQVQYQPIPGSPHRHSIYNTSDKTLNVKSVGIELMGQ